MMRWIVASSVKSRGLVVALAFALIGVGVWQLPRMSKDVLPEFTPPTVDVQTEALGLSAVEVEQLITVPMEQELFNGLPWLHTIRSKSVPGLSSIELTFNRGTDILRARQVVQERLTQVIGLPNVATKPPAMLQPLSSTSRVMMIGLSSKRLSSIEMGVLARWTIRPRLMGVPGVANVAIWGQQERQLQVRVDPERLRTQGVSLDQVIRTTGNALWVSPLTFLEASTPGTGGFIDTPNQRLGVQHLSPIKTPDDLAQVAIEDKEGPPLRLGDVANVVEDHQALIGEAVLPDNPGLLLVVEKFPWANTLEVTHRVGDALGALRPGLVGVQIDPSLFRPASFIERAEHNLTWSLLIGTLLLVLIIGALILDWRSILVRLVAIVLSLVAATLVLDLRGAALNAMTVAGLVLAVVLVVDDAVLDVDEIERRLRRRRPTAGHDSMAAIVLESSVDIRGRIIYGTLIAIVALAPVLFMRGLPSESFLRPIAVSYVLAVAASTLVALTVAPALSTMLLSRPSPEAREPARWWFPRPYGAALSHLVGRPRLVLVGSCALVLVGVGLGAQLDPSLLPSFKDTDLLVHWDAAPGTSLAEMSRVTARASAELRTLPGVRDVSVHVGRAVTSDQVVGSNSGQLWVHIAPSAEYDRAVASVRKVVDGYPGFRQDVLTYPQERIREVLGRHDDPIVVRIYGEDLGVLRDKAEEVRRMLSRVDGVLDARVERQVEEPTLQVEVNLAAAERAGVKPGDVRRAAAVLLSGIQAGSLFEQQKVFDVVVWGAPEIRRNLTSVRNLLIDAPSGEHVRLGDVADVRIAPSPNVIRHEDVSRQIDVTARVRGRDVGSVASDVRHRLGNVKFPLEYHAELQGDYAQRRAAERRVLGFAIAAAAVIFLLLQAAFGSWRLAALAVLTLPVALVGGVVALFLAGGPLSIGALMGFFAVLGLAGRDSVVSIGRYQGLEGEGRERSEVVVRCARERLVPIVVTACTAAVALLPLVVFGDVPGHEVLHPMAVVVLGGLVTATLVSLFVVPAVYVRFGSRRSQSGPHRAASPV